MEMKLHCSFAPYIETRVENFDLLIYVIYKTYTKAMLCKFLSYFFATVKGNCLPTYLDNIDT